MKKILNSLGQDKLAMTGLLLIILSSLVFLFTTEMKQSSSPGAFFINYLLSGIYSLLVFIRSLSRRDTRYYLK